MEKIDGHIASPKGFYAHGIHAQLKKKRLDMGVIYCEVPANAVAVYTTNLFQAAPITVTKESLAKGRTLQGVIVNSGNANACTGKQGVIDAIEMKKLTAQQLGIPVHMVAVASTGVIGELLPMEKIRKGIFSLSPSKEEGVLFHEAILTTDLVKKAVTYQLKINGEEVIISGVAKGSGMIHPNMATMLGFITTDANIESSTLQEILRDATNQTFNQITVDGDTSTNDMVLVMASGLANHQVLHKNHPDYQLFCQVFTIVCQELAKAIAKDGEGATKLIEVHVLGAKNNSDANMIAKKIVGSSLVKAAMFGEDANWGRIICAIGYSGVDIDVNNIDIFIEDIAILQQSEPVSYDKEEMVQYLKEDTVHIYAHVGLGEGRGTAWGCDLSYDYVKINACYRT